MTDADHHAWDIERSVAAGAASRFDGVADSYDAVRPGYPSAVFDAIRAYAEPPGAPGALRVLEIGIGTGQATAEMCARGWHVVGIEPGANLAAVARDRLAGRAHVEVLTATFESALVEPASFDVVASATAWHWVDPGVGYEKAARLLRPDGVVALVVERARPRHARPALGADSADLRTGRARARPVGAPHSRSSRLRPRGGAARVRLVLRRRAQRVPVLG